MTLEPNPLCAPSMFSEVNKERYNPENIMVMAAFRYCLSRKSYIVGICVDWIIKKWESIDECHQRIIKNEIIEALARDQDGILVDKEGWTRLLKFIDENI